MKTIAIALIFLSPALALIATVGQQLLAHAGPQLNQLFQTLGH
jgi:hypothetical protein